MSIAALADRWHDLANGVMHRRIRVESNNYPSSYEDQIQLYVQYKRTGRYEEAISGYLSILEVEGKVYPAILLYMYKCVLCAGEVNFAYEVITYAEFFAKMAWGMSHPYFGDWDQTVKRKEFESFLTAALRYSPATFSMFADYDTVTENKKKRYDLFNQFAGKYSGQSDYHCPIDDLCMLIDKCGSMYEDYKEYFRKYR